MPIHRIDSQPRLSDEGTGATSGEEGGGGGGVPGVMGGDGGGGGEAGRGKFGRPACKSERSAAEALQSAESAMRTASFIMFRMGLRPFFRFLHISRRRCVVRRVKLLACKVEGGEEERSINIVQHSDVGWRMWRAR